MKALALFTALFVSSFAQAEVGILPAQQVFSPLHVLENRQPTGLTGVLTLDHARNEIKVELFEDPCGSLQPIEPGTFRCLAAAMLRESYTVPVKSERIECGSRVISGVRDLRIADGDRVEITVYDHSTRVCRDLVRSKLMVTVEIESVIGTRQTIELLR